jgi:glutamine amidotransferase
MCRFAAYAGPPAPLSTLLYDAPHSLEVQAYAPRVQHNGLVNVDGTGVAWWPEPGPPLRYVTDRPPWSDPNLPLLAPRLEAELQVVAVRSATPGLPLGTASVAPFLIDDLAGAHNGAIASFRDGCGRALLERLPDDLHAMVEVASDSLVLVATVARRLRERPDGGLAGAVTATIAEVTEVCQRHQASATLNLVVADGRQIVASRSAVGTTANSLYVLAGGARWPQATIVASEPLDDDAGWAEVADGSLVTVTPDGTVAIPLDPDRT